MVSERFPDYAALSRFLGTQSEPGPSWESNPQVLRGWLELHPTLGSAARDEIVECMPDEWGPEHVAEVARYYGREAMEEVVEALNRRVGSLRVDPNAAWDFVRQFLSPDDEDRNVGTALFPAYRGGVVVLVPEPPPSDYVVLVDQLNEALNTADPDGLVYLWPGRDARPWYGYTPSDGPQPL